MAGAVSAPQTWTEVKNFDDLSKNLTAGDSTKLSQNIETESGQLVLETGTAYLDLNGCTLTMKIDKSAIVIGNATKGGGASLTVLDSKGNGKIISKNNYLFFVRNSSTLTLESGTFEAKLGAIAGMQMESGKILPLS